MFLWENGHIHFSSNIGKNSLKPVPPHTHTQDSSMPRAMQTLGGVKDTGRCSGNTKPGSCCIHNHPQVTVIVRREAGEHGVEETAAVGPACWGQEGTGEDAAGSISGKFTPHSRALLSSGGFLY